MGGVIKTTIAAAMVVMSAALIQMHVTSQVQTTMQMGALISQETASTLSQRCDSMTLCQALYYSSDNRILLDSGLQNISDDGQSLAVSLPFEMKVQSELIKSFFK